MNVGRAAGKNEGIKVAGFCRELRRGQPQGDLDGLRAGCPGSDQVLVLGFALALKFFFSSAIRDTDTDFGAGIGGHGKPILSFAMTVSNWVNAAKIIDADRFLRRRAGD